jgi:hypothetical protein
MAGEVGVSSHSGARDDGVEFERIVSGFRHGDPVPDVGSGLAYPAHPIRLRMRNGAFAGVSLAVIIPMSMIVGGWFGLAVTALSIVVAVRLVRSG